jgi:hypothetical protein
MDLSDPIWWNMCYLGVFGAGIETDESMKNQYLSAN